MSRGVLTGAILPYAEMKIAIKPEADDAVGRRRPSGGFTILDQIGVWSQGFEAMRETKHVWTTG